MPPFLALERLDKSFGSTPVLSRLSLAVGRGEVLALLGPSGSGKTTALRLIAGFEAPDPECRGRVLIEDEDVTDQPPARRNIGMVFQHYALFPHLSVGENVAFGLAARKLAAEAVARRVAEVLALVDLAGFEPRRVDEISGGQQQRVALARALAPEPRLLLLDEPLSNLDPTLRERTRRELKQGLRRVGITTVLVTHEQEEAFYLADRVAVLAGGVLHQVGSPEELYERPATRFVASFVGRASELPGRFEDGAARPPGSAAAVAGPPGAPDPPTAPGSAGSADSARSAGSKPAERPGRVRFDLAAGTAGAVAWEGVAGAGVEPGAPAVLVLRPEALRLVPRGSAGALPGRVVERRYAGALATFQVALAAAGGGARRDIELEVLAGPHAAAVGDEVAVARDPAGPVPRIYAESG